MLKSVRGARVRSFDEVTLESTTSEVLEVVQSGVKEVFEMVTARGRKVKASADHLFFTPRGWLQLKDLSEGDEVYVQQLRGTSRMGLVKKLTPDPIVSILPVGREMTYDLVLEGNHNFLGNGVVVHNSYNEESGRYRELQPVFYVPGPERNLVQHGKPGAYEFMSGSEDQHALVVEMARDSASYAYENYLVALEAGIAREVARIWLPLNIYSSAYVTMNARALTNFLSLRTKSPDAALPSYPQREIEMVAEQMEAIWADLMPITHAAFVKNGRVAL